MGGTFIFNCLSCGQPLQGALEHVGQLVECPYCSFRLPVPSPPAPSAPRPAYQPSPPGYQPSPSAYQQSPPSDAPPQYSPPPTNPPPMQVQYRPFTPADGDSGNEIRALDEPASPAPAPRSQPSDPFAGNAASFPSAKDEAENAFGGGGSDRVVERVIERVVYEPPPRGFFKALIFDTVGLILILGGIVCAGYIFIQAGRIVVDPDSMKPQLDKISKLIDADSLDIEKDGKKARWGKPLSMILLQLWYFIQAIIPLMAMSVGARVAWPDAKKKDDD